MLVISSTFLLNICRSCAGSLIEINKELEQPAAAVGVIEYSGKNYRRGEVKLKEEWFEMLNQWDTALQVYERSLSTLYTEVAVDKVAKERKKKREEKEADGEGGETKREGEGGKGSERGEEEKEKEVVVDVREVIDTRSEFVGVLCGKLRCLDALGEWDRLIACVHEVWDYCDADASSSSFFSTSSSSSSSSSSAICFSTKSSPVGGSLRPGPKLRRNSEWNGQTGKISASSNLPDDDIFVSRRTNRGPVIPSVSSSSEIASALAREREENGSAAAAAAREKKSKEKRKRTATLNIVSEIDAEEEEEDLPDVLRQRSVSVGASTRGPTMNSPRQQRNNRFLSSMASGTADGGVVVAATAAAMGSGGSGSGSGSDGGSGDGSGGSGERGESKTTKPKSSRELLKAQLPSPRESRERMRREMAPLAARAAWSLSRWDDMSSYVKHVPYHTYDGAFFRSVLSLRSGALRQGEFYFFIFLFFFFRFIFS